MLTDFIFLLFFTSTTEPDHMSKNEIFRLINVQSFPYYNEDMRVTYGCFPS